MGRYRGSRCRLCRRVNKKLFLKGRRCMSDKCSLERRKVVERSSRVGSQVGRLSVYGIQLAEKQKVKAIYGVSERELKKYYKMSKKKKGLTGAELLILLERRLDNVIYRLKFAKARREARQMISHQHILVNGKKVDIPSFLVKAGDVISVKYKLRDKIISNIEESYAVTPAWLECKKDEELRGLVLRLPTREDIDLDIDESLIVSFYSR